MHDGSDLTRRLRFYAGNSYRFLTTPWKQYWIDPHEATTIFGCSFGDSGWNHLRQTLQEYDANASISPFETSLHRFLAGFRPSSICDLVDMTDLPDRPLPLFVYPWGSFRKGETTSKKDPWKSRFCGPSATAFVTEEFQRTIALYKAMRATGYRPWSYPNSFVGGTFLIASDGSRRFVVLQGNHRFAVLAHLGYRQIPVRDVRGYLNRVCQTRCKDWPLVRSKACSATLANRIFRMFFDEDGHHVLRQLPSHGYSPSTDTIQPVSGDEWRLA